MHLRNCKCDLLLCEITLLYFIHLLLLLSLLSPLFFLVDYVFGEQVRYLHIHMRVLGRS